MAVAESIQTVAYIVSLFWESLKIGVVSQYGVIGTRPLGGCPLCRITGAAGYFLMQQTIPERPNRTNVTNRTSAELAAFPPCLESG